MYYFILCIALFILEQVAIHGEIIHTNSQPPVFTIHTGDKLHGQSRKLSTPKFSAEGIFVPLRFEPTITEMIYDLEQDLSTSYRTNTQKVVAVSQLD